MNALPRAEAHVDTAERRAGGLTVLVAAAAMVLGWLLPEVGAQATDPAVAAESWHLTIGDVAGGLMGLGGVWLTIKAVLDQIGTFFGHLGTLTEAAVETTPEGGKRLVIIVRHETDG